MTDNSESHYPFDMQYESDGSSSDISLSAYMLEHEAASASIAYIQPSAHKKKSVDKPVQISPSATKYQNDSKSTTLPPSLSLSSSPEIKPNDSRISEGMVLTLPSGKKVLRVKKSKKKKRGGDKASSPGTTNREIKNLAKSTEEKSPSPRTNTNMNVKKSSDSNKSSQEDENKNETTPYLSSQALQNNIFQNSSNNQTSPSNQNTPSDINSIAATLVSTNHEFISRGLINHSQDNITEKTKLGHKEDHILISRMQDTQKEENLTNGDCFKNVDPFENDTSNNNGMIQAAFKVKNYTSSAMRPPTDISEYSEDGSKNEVSSYEPMWQKAINHSQKRVDTQSQKSSDVAQMVQGNGPKHAKIKQSLLDKTKSRADVDTVDGVFIAPDLAAQSSDESMRRPVSRTPSKDVLIPLKIRPKRTKVVQLLLFGVIGILFGFLGSIYALTTCQFIVAKVRVGDNDNIVSQHFGMWKYSPLESVFNSYSYCLAYDDEYSNEAPSVLRFLSFLSLLTATFSLSVLWVYLILGIASHVYWQRAVQMLLVSGFLQCSSFIIFGGELCSQNRCTFGPGAVMSLITTIIWLILSYEMFRNVPESAKKSGKTEVSINPPLDNFELPELTYHLKNEWGLSPLPSTAGTTGSSTLADIARQFHLKNTQTSKQESFTDESSYSPPIYDSDSTASALV